MTRPLHPRRGPGRARRGSVYLVVLSAMSVSMIVVSAGLLAARAHAGRVASLAESAAAARAAESGLEAALATARSEVWYRQSVASAPVVSLTLPEGTVSVSMTDPVDGVLDNDSTGTVLFTATGLSGQARRVLSVRATPGTAPASVLSAGLVVNGNLSMDTCRFWSRSPVRANGAITLAASTLESTSISAASASGSGFTPAAATGGSAVTLPAFSDLLAEYGAIGTSGVMGGTGAISLTYSLVGPANPPWALAANASGVYVIDLQGRRLTLDYCHIVGTLVCRNASGGVRVTGCTFWEPAVAGYPALIVDGPLSLTTARADHIESSYPKNMNPAGMPYQGVTDTDTSDRYATEFTGLVYATGDLTMSGGFSSTAPLLIGGNATIANTVGLLRGVTPASGPPGLRAAPAFLLDRSSWKRLVD